MKLTIVPKDQTEPIFPSIQPGWITADLVGAAVLEAGMESGAHSIMFHVELPGGKGCIVQTSGAILESLHAALQGAKARFGAKPSGVTH